MNAKQDADSIHDVPVATETTVVLGFRVLPSYRNSELSMEKKHLI
jgi:hypothetical protein